MYTLEKINEAFNETLEEISIEDNEQYSMEFVQHHEATIAQKLKQLKVKSGFQFILMLATFLFIILNQNNRFIYIPYEYNRYVTLALWTIILLNSLVTTRRGKRIKAMEQQLLLIDVYKKIIH